MDFMFTYIKYFSIYSFYFLPAVIPLMLTILCLGLYIGKREGWSRFNSIYFSFITAITIGYGDFVPRLKITKVLAVLIGLNGLVLTGLMVGIAMESMKKSFAIHYDAKAIEKSINAEIEADRKAYHEHKDSYLRYELEHSDDDVKDLERTREEAIRPHKDNSHDNQKDSDSTQENIQKKQGDLDSVIE
ncbi:MAG: potassium channel family protein [Lentisphaeria bacterium]|nr:potassium channel family protein [Lentisphaeria bacterium]